MILACAPSLRRKEKKLFCGTTAPVRPPVHPSTRPPVHPSTRSPVHPFATDCNCESGLVMAKSNQGNFDHLLHAAMCNGDLKRRSTSSQGIEHQSPRRRCPITRNEEKKRKSKREHVGGVIQGCFWKFLMRLRNLGVY